jgi:hypothetical protein
MGLYQVYLVRTADGEIVRLFEVVVQTIRMPCWRGRASEVRLKLKSKYGNERGLSAGSRFSRRRPLPGNKPPNSSPG